MERFNQYMDMLVKFILLVVLFIILLPVRILMTIAGKAQPGKHFYRRPQE